MEPYMIFSEKNRIAKLNIRILSIIFDLLKK